jgi:Ca2+:H+ antiporter
MPPWTWLVPAAAAALLAASLAFPIGGLLLGACALALVGAVIASVHHAEVVAHRVGEPFGTLVLAVAITVIEAALILTVMFAGGTEKAGLARDTIYAAVMIIVNGVVGVCVLLGALEHREQSFRIEGSGPALAALITLATLTLVLPSFTTSSTSGTFTEPQLVFAAIVSFVVWALFVFVQTVRHRDYFLPSGAAAGEDVHAAPPSTAMAWASFGLLMVSLVGVVGLAKALSPSIEGALEEARAPKAVIGIVIAMLVLAPETWAAIRQARSDRLQISMNLAIGSALASIGLTIPVVVAAALWFGLPLELGLQPKEIVLLALSFVVGTITLGSGRTTLMQGAVHLVIFAVFVFLAFVP